MQKDKIIIYTDGAARGNPGPAGWGVLIMMGKKHIELGGRSGHATNNQMELQSAIEALKFVHKNISRIVLDIGTETPNIEIYADSKYVILGITEWIQGWIKSGWKNSQKKPVLNRELWEELYMFVQNFNIKWHYVAGHSGHQYNDRVDEIATSFADGEPVLLKN
ncbi:MAG: ribonuclease HI [bacterium]|nr:ribonuclease HI [bacterium]